MRIGLILGALSYIGIFTNVAYGKFIIERKDSLNTSRLSAASEAGDSTACVMTGISGLWPDENGGWIGSSKIEWQDCTDGNNYVAECTHRGSGESMESCACFINNSLAYDRNCQGLSSSPDLLEASRQCCGYFEELSPKGPS